MPGTPGSSSAVLRGAPATLLSGPSPLGSAAEEVSLHLGSKVENKTHSERRIRASAPPRTPSAEQIRYYLETVGRAELLEDFTLQARLGEPAGHQDPFDSGGQGAAGQDPVERYLLLLHAREVAASRGADPQTLDRIDQAAAAAYEQAPDVIQTRLATIEHAASYAHDPQEVPRFQGALDSLLGQPTLSLALKEILDLAGRSGERLEPAMDSLMKALGNCLSLPGWGTEKRLLETLITDLYHLKALRTVLEECRGLVREFRPLLISANTVPGFQGEPPS